MVTARKNRAELPRSEWPGTAMGEDFVERASGNPRDVSPWSTAST